MPTFERELLRVALELIEDGADFVCRVRRRGARAAGLRRSAAFGKSLDRLRRDVVALTRMNTGARSMPSGVQSLKVTSTTSLRLEPGGGPMQRRLFGEGRILARELAKRFEQLRDDVVGEPRAGVAGVLQLVAGAVTEQQRAERLARALAFRVSADDELRGLRRFDLEPVRASACRADTCCPCVSRRCLRTRSPSPRRKAAQHHRRRARAECASTAAGIARDSGADRCTARRAD